MKKTIVAAALCLLLFSCSGGGSGHKVTFKALDATSLEWVAVGDPVTTGGDGKLAADKVPSEIGSGLIGETETALSKELLKLDGSHLAAAGNSVSAGKEGGAFRWVLADGSPIDFATYKFEGDAEVFLDYAKKYFEIAFYGISKDDGQLKLMKRIFASEEGNKVKGSDIPTALTDEMFGADWVTLSDDLVFPAFSLPKYYSSEKISFDGAECLMALKGNKVKLREGLASDNLIDEHDERGWYMCYDYGDGDFSYDTAPLDGIGFDSDAYAVVKFDTMYPEIEFCAAKPDGSYEETLRVMASSASGDKFKLAESQLSAFSVPDGFIGDEYVELTSDLFVYEEDHHVAAKGNSAKASKTGSSYDWVNSINEDADPLADEYESGEMGRYYLKYEKKFLEAQLNAAAVGDVTGYFPFAYVVADSDGKITLPGEEAIPAGTVEVNGGDDEVTFITTGVELDSELYIGTTKIFNAGVSVALSTDEGTLTWLDSTNAEFTGDTISADTKLYAQVYET